MLFKTFAAAVHGIDATIVTIETYISKGAQFMIVGLPDSAVKESHERILAAIQVLGLEFPRDRIVVNMAPADIRKEGSAYDLPLALGILATIGRANIQEDMLKDYVTMGELSLDGTLQPVKGILPIAIKAREEGYKGLIVPIQNVREAAVVNKINVYGAENLKEVLDFFKGGDALKPTVIDTRKDFFANQHPFSKDFSEVRGQENVKRAMEVAAAGGHNLIMVGPPGSGKSMIAQRLPSILPPFTLPEALETTKIHSVAGRVNKETSLLTERPFCSPHHTISNVAMVGGGTYPQPGEISLAHNGVLFLDELPEFNRNVLEVLRQPLEERRISISRARFAVDYPASFMLIASMNPCPCGFYNHPTRSCTCPPGHVKKYMNKVSGPLLDRIDIQIEITPVAFEKISEFTPAEPSAAIRERVLKARDIQSQRFGNDSGIYCNAQMSPKQIRDYARISKECLAQLKLAMEKFNLSARAYDRILKVARTIADLAGDEDITVKHIGEAIHYRSLDRETWGL